MWIDGMVEIVLTYRYFGTLRMSGMLIVTSLVDNGLVMSSP